LLPAIVATTQTCNLRYCMYTCTRVSLMDTTLHVSSCVISRY